MSQPTERTAVDWLSLRSNFHHRRVHAIQWVVLIAALSLSDVLTTLRKHLSSIASIESYAGNAAQTDAFSIPSEDITEKES